MPSSGKVSKSQLHSDKEAQKKLQLRKKNEKKKMSAAELQLSSTFGVQDELNLQLPMDESPAPVSVQLPQVPQVMKDQIRGLKDENGRLFQLLKEKDFEIRQLQKFKSDHALSLNMPGLTSDTAAVKIVELSKKLRETVAEMEVEKTKCKQLAKKCEELKLQIANPKECHTAETKINIDEQKSAEEFKSLQEKLKQAESKMADWRNQYQILKQEMKLANRVILQEVGEGFNLHSLVSGKSTWKGRMQQIITLQQKNSELRQQVEDLQATNGINPKETLASERNNSNPAIRRLVQERKEAHDKVLCEFKELQEQHASLKTKFESVKARNQVLSNEVKILKQQIQTLLDKGQHDDEMITTLMSQLSHLKNLMQDNKQQKVQNVQQNQTKSRESSVTKQNEEYVVEQLNRIIAERDEKIRALSQRLKHMSGETTPKGEIFCFAPVADPGTEKNSQENALIQEYIFNSNNDSSSPGSNKADIHMEYPQNMFSIKENTTERLTNEVNLNSAQTAQDRLPAAAAAAEGKINVIQQEQDDLRRNSVLENEISKEDALKNNETKIQEQYQVPFGGKSILSIDTSLIDGDELKTVLEIEEDKKETMNEVAKTKLKKHLR